MGCLGLELGSRVQASGNRVQNVGFFVLFVGVRAWALVPFGP